MNDPLVSVVIPTKNSSKTLSKCLKSILGQTYGNIEIIVVDNYSIDDTISIARRSTDLVFTTGTERSSQVNYGVTKASGKYIYEVGSDFILSDPNIIRDAVSLAEANNYAAVLIHNTSDPTVSYWARVRKFERDMYASDDLNVAVRFIRRDIFLTVGGFDAALVAGEDYDLHNRISERYSIGRIEAQEIHIGEPKSIKEIAQKHYYYGKTISLFLKKNKSRGFRQMSPIRAAYLKNYRSFIRHPDLTIGFMIYQIVRYASVSLGLLAPKIINTIRKN